METVKRPGRKPRRADPGERISLGLRVTPGVKNQLDAAAKLSGRTQSTEAAIRIEMSFQHEKVLDEVINRLYGCISGDLLMGVVGAVFTAGAEVCRTQHIEHWLDDAALQKEVATTLRFLIGGERPKPDRGVTVTVAEALLRQIVVRVMTSTEWQSERRERLGPYADLIEGRVRDLQQRYETGPKPLISTHRFNIESGGKR